MPYQATAVNVMIASPGDVGAERQAIQCIIHNWNSMNSEERRTVLMPIMWETHSTPVMGDRAQAIVNRQVLAKCDLLVAVFWTRLGSPTGSSPSGTVEEIQEHLRSGKPAMIYFSKKPVALDSVDVSQYEALNAFRAECQKKGLIATYDSLQEFSDEFSRHLSHMVRDRFAHVQLQPQADDSVLQIPAAPKISEQARLLLITAVEGGGEVIRVRVMGGTIISAGSRQLAKTGDRRDEAQWDAALQELVDNNLLEFRSHKNAEVLAVTHAGYEAADALKAEMPATSVD